LYEAGQGVPRDEAKAMQLYREAAQKHHPGGAYNLAVMYEFGRGGPQDQTEAAKWYAKAADAGEPLAQFNLGQRYMFGIGVSNDPIEAYKWLTLAAAGGVSDALKFSKQLEPKMSAAQLAEARQRASRIATGTKD
jgi:TPR repeat protein